MCMCERCAVRLHGRVGRIYMLQLCVQPGTMEFTKWHRNGTARQCLQMIPDNWQTVNQSMMFVRKHTDATEVT